MQDEHRAGTAAIVVAQRSHKQVIDHRETGDTMGRPMSEDAHITHSVRERTHKEAQQANRHHERGLGARSLSDSVSQRVSLTEVGAI